MTTRHHIVSRTGLLGVTLAALAALLMAASSAATAQSPSISGGAWQFDAGSSGNVVSITYDGIPAAGLGASDVSVAFDSSVLTVSACSTGDLDGACNPNAPNGPARAAGFKAPAITSGPVTIATLTLDCAGSGNSALSITVNELVDGSSGGAAISAGVSNGSVTCGETASPPPAPTATPGGLPPTGANDGSSGTSLVVLVALATAAGVVFLGSLGAAWALRRRER